MLISAKDLPDGFTGEAKPKTTETRDTRLIAAVAKGFAPTIAEYVANQIKPLLARIAELEARPMPSWQGAFVEGRQYRELSFCVHAGSLWVSKVSTTSKPGTDGTWQLACKRGAHQ